MTLITEQQLAHPIIAKQVLLPVVVVVVGTMP